jgi:hypothetical protein
VGAYTLTSEVTMVVRFLLSTVLLVAVFGCAPKGGNLGRRANAPTPDAIGAARVPVLPGGDVAVR